MKPQWLESLVPGGGTPPASREFAMARVWYGFMTARVMIATVLLMLQISIMWLGQSVTHWIFVFCAVHVAAALVVRVVGKPLAPGQSFDPQWLPTIGVDLIAYSVLQWVQLGSINYAPLYALPVLLAAVLGSLLLALGTAAGVTLLLLVDAWWMGAQGGDPASRYLQAALTGTGFFVVAFLANQLASRLVREEQEARRSQLAARTQIRVNELVIETLGDGILVVDANGIVRVINPAARSMLGLDASHGAPFVLAGDPAWHPLVDLSHGTFALQSGKSADATLVHAGQMTQRVQVRTRLTGGEDASSGETESLCVMFLQDLREMEARIRTEKLAAMGRMSAAVAHEIRNPLAAITQANALLMEDLNEPTHRKLTKMVSQNARRLARIVDEVLELARAQDAKQPAPSRSIAIDDVVHLACAEWLVQAGIGNCLSVRVDAPGAFVFFEPEHLRRVLVNLLDNARRYASGRAASICVGTRSEEGTPSVRMSVWSDGPPLEASVQAHLFEPFFSSESRSSGLGLYICRELCARHGAFIGYRRTGQGDTQSNEFFVDFVLDANGSAHTVGELSGFATIGTQL